MKQLMTKLTLLVIFISSLSSYSAFAGDEISRQQVLEVLNVIMSGKKITQTFGGKYSTQIVDIKNVDINLRKSTEGRGILLQVGHMNPIVKNLNEIFVDDVSIKDAISMKPRATRLMEGSASENDEMSRKEVLEVLNVIMSGKKITQTFGGKYSTQIVDIKNVDINLRKSTEGRGFWLKVGRLNPTVKNLNEIFVDDVSIKDLLPFFPLTFTRGIKCSNLLK